MYQAKKSLGQNFLKSEMVLRKIIEAGEIKKDDVVLEIGPGRGALTERLLEKSNHVIAVEKDRELFKFLETKFEKEIKNNTLILVCEDILKFNVKQNILGRTLECVRQGLTQYKIIANIPYNITGAILKKFLTEENQPTSMVLMVQHEVAQRIIAQDKKESILSISVKAYGEPKMIAKVDKRYFKPMPKVNSAIIAIKNISRKNFPSLLVKEGAGDGDSKNHHPAFGTPPQKGGEARFWEIVKKGFAHKRKKLSGNLKNLCQRDSLTVYANKRAEDLTLGDWIKLVNLAG